MLAIAVWIGITGSLPLNWSVPSLAIILAFVAIRKWSEPIQAFMLVVIGLTNDFLTGDMVGTYALGLLASAAILRSMNMRVEVNHPEREIAIFALFALIALVIRWLLASLAELSFFPLNATLIQLLGTCALYAVFAVIRHQGRRFSRRARFRRHMLRGSD